MSKIWVTYGYSWRHYMTHPWKFIRDSLKTLKWDVQRARRGWADCDAWEIFSYFIKIMSGMLKYYKKNKCGYPVVIDNYPVKSNPTEEDLAAIDQNMKEWDDIIDRMLSLLEDMDELNDKYEDKPLRETCGLIEQAKDCFFELFSKYFYYLWD